MVKIKRDRVAVAAQFVFFEGRKNVADGLDEERVRHVRCVGITPRRMPDKVRGQAIHGHGLDELRRVVRMDEHKQPVDLLNLNRREFAFRVVVRPLVNAARQRVPVASR